MDLELHSIQTFFKFIHLQVIQCPPTSPKEILLLIEKQPLPTAYQLK